ncbi:POZ domain-containing protein KCTD15 [Seminavis robusta]|uniref:POZ domain-containing protein KCTD15 n=1 Tax=Seminavis robusta TaxID=568900 RepID=A0A9N8EDY6_9STRA|nr:POZ domain-containing protein KCTD15 [Seminavis robusta]|eukprot:Sro801_g204520.1 POZ domain-containing protein KCTD15 (231) ;mRNA; r:32388-33080
METDTSTKSAGDEVNDNQLEGTESKAEPKTVELKVGGTMFTVSKALIEQYPDTMLARMISETWNKKDSNDQALFIERDGEIFRHVLAYMRDLKVKLLTKMAKRAVLKELEYFGFQNVDEDAVESGVSRGEAAAMIVATGNNHTKRVRELKLMQFCEILAFEFFNRYCGDGDLQMQTHMEDMLELGAPEISLHNWDESIFCKCLAEYGSKAHPNTCFDSDGFMSVELERLY